MDKIDDPYAAAKSQYPEPLENLPGELSLCIAGQVIPIFGIVNAIRNYYSWAAVNERLSALIDAVNSKTNALEARVDSPASAEAVRLAVEETWRTTDVERVKRYGAILGNSIADKDNPNAMDEAVEHIRAVAQLSDRDIQALRALLTPGVSLVMQRYSNLHDPNPFMEQWENVAKAAAAEKLTGDDFYSACKRLEGFGLAIELPRNPARQSPGEYAFRPTRRSERLVALLQGKTA